MNIKKAIKILDIKNARGLDDLRQRFHVLAHQYHPDKNPEQDTTEIFRSIVEAYEYSLHHIKDFYQFFHVTPEPDIEEKTAKVVIENFDDIFEDIFGFSKTDRILGYLEPQVLYLTVKEFLTGAKKHKKLICYKKCPDCHGQGSPRGSLARICTYCFGQGVVKNTHNPSKKQKPCPRCHGRGRTTTLKCERCDGFGRLKDNHLQSFYVPIALKPFEHYTIQSHDLVTKTDTEICIEPRPLRDPIFQIDNYNLLCQYHLDFQNHHEALVLKINTPIEPVSINIKKNAREGDVICVPGVGLYKTRTKDKRGDLLIVLKNKKTSFFNRLFGKGKTKQN